MEGSVRVFAGEYDGSTLSVQEDDSQVPAWVVTPGGAYCRFMYLSGTLTEVTETGDMVHFRISDPTGAFDLVTGGRNSALAETIRKLGVPSFVTVTGRAQMYQKGGRVVLSVRPDHIQSVSRLVRDQWVITTAQLTLERLLLMNHALQGTCSDDRILVAFRHYSITKTRLRELAVMVERAVNAARPVECEGSEEPDIRTLVMELIHSGSGPRGISVDQIIQQAAMSGVSQEAVLAVIESLIIDDECYQPQKGFVKPL
jgi:RPA family protein